MSASEPPWDASKGQRRRQNQGREHILGQAWRIPGYWPCGVRRTGGMTPAWASVQNVRTCLAMPREKAQAGGPREAERTDALVRGGLPRSSGEPE
jgi:hypothetical protein